MIGSLVLFLMRHYRSKKDKSIDVDAMVTRERPFFTAQAPGRESRIWGGTTTVGVSPYISSQS